MLSTSTRFVHGCGTFFDVDVGEQQIERQNDRGREIAVSDPLSRQNQRSNFFRQDKGPEVFRLLTTSF